MSDMKCPFCNGELVGTIGHPICRNQNCVMCDDPMPQDLLEELIRTRKALEIAVDALKSAKKRFELINNSKFANLNNVLQIQSQCEVLKIDEALEQITALEQKEHFADVSKKIEQKESAFVHNKIEFPEFNDGLLEEFDKQFFENGQDDDLTETALEQKD